MSKLMCNFNKEALCIVGGTIAPAYLTTRKEARVASCCLFGSFILCRRKTPKKQLAMRVEQKSHMEDILQKITIPQTSYDT